MTGLSVVCLLLFLVLPAPVLGACFTDRNFVDESTGKTYCMAENRVLEVNQWIVTPDCFNCTCHEKMLNCCGVGVRAEAIGPPPPGYKVQMVLPCGYTFVPRTSEDFYRF